MAAHGAHHVYQSGASLSCGARFRGHHDTHRYTTNWKQAHRTSMTFARERQGPTLPNVTSPYVFFLPPSPPSFSPSMSFLFHNLFKTPPLSLAPSFPSKTNEGQTPFVPKKPGVFTVSRRALVHDRCAGWRMWTRNPCPSTASPCDPSSCHDDLLLGALRKT